MADIHDFLAFLDESPTPFHAVTAAARRLEGGGFRQVGRRGSWTEVPHKGFTVNGGSLIAWVEPRERSAGDGFRIVGAHTDSPCLRVKHHHDRIFPGAAVLALEPYGGIIVESWLDRDLGLAGRLVLSDGTEHLVRVDEPWLNVPRLAIHLDRGGSPLDPQRHLDGIWATEPKQFLGELARVAGVEVRSVAAFEIMAFDLQQACLVGQDGALLASARLDNLATSWAGVEALLQAPDEQRSVLVLYDHEEVGSSSDRGAASPFLETVLERLVLASGGGREELHRALASSLLVSGDMAHALHPNHPEKHEPLHQIELGGGPVVKINQNLRYASDARGSAVLARVAKAEGVRLQHYVHRADLPCGSTIGPIAAARTGILTVDVGAPQLAMHSIRETMAVDDQLAYRDLLAGVLKDRVPTRG